MCKFVNTEGRTITYEDVRRAMSKPYTMSLTGRAIKAVMAAVNQGIDAHLEACFVPERGDLYAGGARRVGSKVMCHTLDCSVSSESLPVLLRRLFELEDTDLEDEAQSLANDILETLRL